MAYIRQYKGRWRAEVQKHGHRETHMADTKREAQAWALRKEAELDALGASGGKTLQAAITHYLNTVSVYKRDPESEARRFNNAVLSYFDPNTPIATIDSEAIGRWRDHRLKSVSGPSVLRDANQFRNLFTRAADEWRWISRNPFKGVWLPKDSAPRTAIWTWPLIKRVLRAPRVGKTAEMQRAFHIALHTGLRLGEVLAGKFDARTRIITLPKTKTSLVPVKVPCTRRAARLLAGSEPFTVGPNEGSTLFSELLRDLLIEGLEFRDSRASALTWLSRRMDVMTLARISRHRDLRILQNTYYRETAEDIAARI